MRKWGPWDWMMAVGIVLALLGWFVSDDGTAGGGALSGLGLLLFLAGAVWQVVVRRQQRRSTRDQ